MPVGRFDLSFGPHGRRRGDSEPMRLVVLADFTGKEVAGRAPLESRRVQRIDVDNFDDVMRRLAPRIDTPAGEIVFQQLDDFHPDRLFARLDVFKSLREARTKPSPQNDDDLKRLLGTRSETGRSGGTAPANEIDALIHHVVAPYVVPDTSTSDQAYIRAVDTTIAESMRMVLHHREFQSIEAAWRGMHWLVSTLELDENLQLHLFDVRRPELLRDIVDSQGKLDETDLYRTLVERSRQVSDSKGWSALVGLIHFGPSPTDAGLLLALAVIASQAGGPLLAGADEALAGDDATVMADWQALRRSEAARWIGLAGPRVLLRLPYGKATDPIESFGFEEFPGAPQHDELLWGNGSLATALLLGRGFTSRGWDMEPGDERELDDLPAYTFVRDGVSEMQACAERFLTESQIQAFLEAGLIPIASRRDRNAVVAIRFQSIADPTAPLAW
jgi:type VI secretion system protein ImpC